MVVAIDLVTASDELRALYGQFLPEQRTGVDAGELEWKFHDNPAGKGLITVGREAGEAIAINGFMASRFLIGDRELIGHQSMDTIVGTAARGKGVFGKLINKFYDQADSALLYGFPNQNSAKGFFGKLGWTKFGEVPMLVRPLSTAPLKRFIPLFPRLPLPVPGQKTKYIRPIARFGENDTQQWQKFSSSIGCAVVRDADYLNWRLVDHPSVKYDRLRAPDGSFVVTTVQDKHGARIGYVMEAIGSPKELPNLLRTALAHLKAQGADLALAWCFPWSPNYRSYRRALFFPFAPRIRPITIYAGARALGGAPEIIENPQNWYVSYLDSDTV